MNRKATTYDDSGDSESDWDSTFNESPTLSKPPKISLPINNGKNTEGLYASVLPKTQSISKGDRVHNTERSSERVKKENTLRDSDAGSKLGYNSSNGDNMKELNAAGLIPPPPHLSGFKNALTDYSSVYEVVPDFPFRGYEGKGKLYTVPEADMFTSPHARDGSWNDSDAEERVLKELQHEREKQKKIQNFSRDKMQMATSAVKGRSAENLGYMSSPTLARPDGSAVENRNHPLDSFRIKTAQPAPSQEHSSEIVKISGNIKESVPASQLLQSKMSSPVIIKDATGKSCIFYFEEGNPHFVEVSDDEVKAYLPEKVDELEKLFRRVWKEVFAALRILTSIFILFFAELILFIVHHIVRPLLLDSVRAVGDFLFKPLFTLLFNVIIQPAFALVWNIFNALHVAMDPLLQLFGAICTQVAVILRAFRLFVVNHHSQSNGSFRQESQMV